ncbi:hypothetical protein LH427_15930, partial [Laribacter hongkongensis]|uniref:hypothetical protein n=1 Tax=Laribacter hongkongensis TaxID=168471 RepID=UPI001EFD62C6
EWKEKKAGQQAARLFVHGQESVGEGAGCRLHPFPDPYLQESVREGAGAVSVLRPFVVKPSFSKTVADKAVPDRA